MAAVSDHGSHPVAAPLPVSSPTTHHLPSLLAIASLHLISLFSLTTPSSPSDTQPPSDLAVAMESGDCRRLALFLPPWSPISFVSFFPSSSVRFEPTTAVAIATAFLKHDAHTRKVTHPHHKHHKQIKASIAPFDYTNKPDSYN